MAGQGENPDFVVDSSGNVQDVRRMRHASSQIPPNGPPGEGTDDGPKPRSRRQPIRTPYLIPIPIGLILYLLVILFRQCNHTDSNPNYLASQKAIQAQEKGERYLYGGDPGQALLYFKEALTAEPDSVDVYNGLGLAYRAMGEMDSALEEFNRALGLAPNSVMILNNRGITYKDMGKHDQAILDLTRAIELKPTFGKAYYNRASVYLALNDYDRAITDLDQAIEHAAFWNPMPTSQLPAPVRRIIGGSEEEREAERSGAPLPSCYANRGLAYLAKGEYDKAIADLNEAVQMQPDLSTAKHALTVAYAAIAQTPSAQAIPKSSSTGAGWPTATDWALPSGTEPAVSFEPPPSPVAVYVPQPYETPTTPVWKITQESCDGQRFEILVSPGRYLYRVTPDVGGSYLVAVVQESKETSPGVGQCRLPWLNYGGASSTGSSDTAAGANERYRNFCDYDSSAPPGADMTTESEIETKRIGLGTFLTVREDTSYKYHLPYPKYVNNPQGTIATSEWYACGYGLIRSWTLHTGKYQGRDFEKEYGLELVSFTPLSTNESHVRHILVDAQLSGNVAAYRAETKDEETAEALRRWEAGVRIVNLDEFERTTINGQVWIVFSGTQDPIMGTDVILTTDS